MFLPSSSGYSPWRPVPGCTCHSQGHPSCLQSPPPCPYHPLPLISAPAPAPAPDPDPPPPPHPFLQVGNYECQL